jgi:transcriptional regulator CtsR
MGITDIIARFIMDEISETGGCAELQRAELAQRFNCVPSQINYVISTRFAPEHGYIVESRRGGNGYIRITRLRSSVGQLAARMIGAIGAELDQGEAEALISAAAGAGLITRREARLLRSAVSPRALAAASREERARLRAGILKNMLAASAAEPQEG